MSDRLISLLHIFGWAGSIICPLLFGLLFWCAMSYEGSIGQSLDKMKGRTRIWPVARFFWLSVLSFSVLYITW